MHWIYTAPGRLWWWLNHPFPPGEKPVWAELAPVLGALITSLFAFYVIFVNRRFSRNDAERSRANAVEPALIVSKKSFLIYNIENVGRGPAINCIYNPFPGDGDIFSYHLLRAIAPNNSEEINLSDKFTEEPEELEVKYTNIFSTHLYTTIYTVKSGWNSYYADTSAYRNKNIQHISDELFRYWRGK